MINLSLREFKSFCSEYSISGFLFECNNHKSTGEPIRIGCRFPHMQIINSQRIVFRSADAFLDIDSVKSVEIGDSIEDYYRKLRLICDGVDNNPCKIIEMIVTF